MKRTRLIAALAVSMSSLALAGASPTAASAAWLDPVDLGGQDNPLYQRVAMTPDGEVLALWRGGSGSSFAVRAVERPVGGPLGGSRDLIPAGAVVENIEISLNRDGDAIVTWRRTDTDTGDIRLQYSFRAAGGAFSGGKFGSPTGADVAQPSVALDDDGGAIAVWREAPGGDQFIHYATRPAGGEFGPVGSVAAESGQSPQVAVDGSGNATAIWVQGLAPFQVRTATRSPGGSFSSPPDSLSGSIFIAGAGLELAVNPSGAAVAAWKGQDGDGDDRIEVALRQPGGSFGPMTRVSPDTVDSRNPSVAIDDAGNVIVAWAGQTTKRVEFATGSVTGGLGPFQTLSGPNGDTPDVAMHPDGRTIAIWTEGVFPNTRAYAASRPAGGSFGSSAPLSPVGEQASDPHVAIDDEGNGVALWLHRTEPGVFSTTRVRLAGYDPVAPRFDSLVFPPSGRPVRSLLSFSATTFDVWGPVTTSWAFGDGGTAVGEFAQHRYRRHGTYQAQATATDAAGNAATQSAAVSAVDRRVRILILGRRIRVNRRRVARLRLRCPKSERSPPCSGRVVVRTARRLPTGARARRLRAGAGRRRIVLARGRFRIAAGRTRAVKLRLGPRKAALVRRNRRARRVLATARVRDRSGNRAKRRKRMRIVPARRGGRRGRTRR